MALSDAEYQAMTPATIESHGQGGYKLAAEQFQTTGVSAWQHVAALYAAVEDTPTWQNLKAADLASDAAYAGQPAPSFTPAFPPAAPPLEDLAAVRSSVSSKVAKVAKTGLVIAALGGLAYAVRWAVRRWI